GGSSRGLAPPPPPLDCRAHHRLAQSLPPPGQGLGEPQPQRPCLPQARLHPPHASKTLQSRLNSSDRLLEPPEPYGFSSRVERGPLLSVQNRLARSHSPWNTSTCPRARKEPPHVSRARQSRSAFATYPAYLRFPLVSQVRRPPRRPLGACTGTREFQITVPGRDMPGVEGPTSPSGQTVLPRS